MKAHLEVMRKPVVVTVLAGVILLCEVTVAQAVSLYWAKTSAGSDYRQCLSLAGATMEHAHIQNIRLSSDEVAGTSGGTYVAITCIDNTAVIMVTGEDAGETSNVRNSLLQRIKNWGNL